MTTFQIDDQACFHAKVLRAGNEAFGAWCRAGSWCMQHLTDGHVTRDVAVTIAGSHVWRKLRDCGLPGSGLVEEVADGYQIHDWAHWQVTSDEIRKHRLDQAKRQQNRRAALRAESKSGAIVTPVVTPPVTRDVPREYTTPDPDPGPDPDQTLPTEVEADASASPPPPFKLTADKPKKVQKTLPGVAKSASSLLTPAAWGVWREKYREAYGTEYLDEPGDNRVLASLITAAKSAASQLRPDDSTAPIALLTHWLSTYLRDEAAYLAQHKHPLRSAMKDLNAYGTPWANGRKTSIPQHRAPLSGKAKPMSQQEREASAQAGLKALETLKGL